MEMKSTTHSVRVFPGNGRAAWRIQAGLGGGVVTKQADQVVKNVATPLSFCFHTHTGSPTGYAGSAALLMPALWRKGVEVHYLYVADDPLYETISPYPLTNALRENVPDFSLPQVVYSVAPLFWHNSGKYKVGWTMMEVDKITEQWVRACNVMDEVWVPTPMQVDIFKASGVRVPVYYVPLGIEPTQFLPGGWAAKWNGPPTFLFLAVGWWQLRKRWDILFEVFSREFGEREDVALVCKIHSDDSDEAITQQAEMFRKGRPGDNIFILNHTMPWWELSALYRMCHCFVLPTAGEGWGYPFVEALACGIPVIATDCLGPGETLRDVSGEVLPGVRLIDSELKPTEVNHPYYSAGNWWVPDADALTCAMHQILDNYTEWKQAARVGSAWVREHRSVDVAAEAVIERLKAIRAL
jgi:glycosyltransferase involved in cell wall biosynthesis